MNKCKIVFKIILDTSKELLIFYHTKVSCILFETLIIYLLIHYWFTILFMMIPYENSKTSSYFLISVFDQQCLMNEKFRIIFAAWARYRMDSICNGNFTRQFKFLPLFFMILWICNHSFQFNKPSNFYFTCK